MEELGAAEADRRWADEVRTRLEEYRADRGQLCPLRSGESFVPEAALEALAGQSIPFTVEGKTTYQHPMAAIRSAAP